ncbi:MAG: 5'/3'-nucleotidase SurE [Desulfobacterales bacterium]|nr:5'/3'-nucleotidase SurE [Desulfobacterales bacterium]
MIIMPAGRAPRPEGRDPLQDAPGHDQEAGVKTMTRARHPSDQRRRVLPGDHPGPVPARWRRSAGPTSSPRTGSGAPALWPSPCDGRSASRRVKPRVWAVEGTPVDCVYFALQKFLPRRPDLIISGMNPGPEPRPAGHQLLGHGRRGHPGDLSRHPLHGRLAPARRPRPLRPEARGGHRPDDRRRRPGLTACRRGPPSTSTSRRLPVKGVKITRLGWKFYDPGDHREDRPPQLDLLLDRHGNAAPRRRRRYRRHGRP